MLCEHQLEAANEAAKEEAKSPASTVEESCPVFTLDEPTMMSIFKPRTKDMEKPFYIPEGCDSQYRALIELMTFLVLKIVN